MLVKTYLGATVTFLTKEGASIIVLYQ